MNSRIWTKYNTHWRNPHQVISHWKESEEFDARLLDYKIKGGWWQILKELKMRLFVTREYEHLVLSMSGQGNVPEISYLRVPHPSGIAINRKNQTVYIASTRNPNQVYEFRQTQGFLKRRDSVSVNGQSSLFRNALVPHRSFFYPGSLYIHDLAMIGDKLFANAVGHNAVVQLLPDGGCQYVWWPKCIEGDQGPRFETNYLQLNAIASGKTIKESFFCASSAEISFRRPGHQNFPVDKRGVVFSGKTREPICTGLTRPHSLRQYQRKLWIDNSGYGEFGFIENGKFQSIVKLPGWTRGLCLKDNVAFVGTSKVIPRFYKYAPGLDVSKSRCAVYAVELKSGKILGSIQWPYGNQIFAVEWAPDTSQGFFNQKSGKSSQDMKKFFYAYKTGR